LLNRLTRRQRFDTGYNMLLGTNLFADDLDAAHPLLARQRRPFAGTGVADNGVDTGGLGLITDQLAQPGFVKIVIVFERRNVRRKNPG
jgi:hypothetical protein